MSITWRIVRSTVHFIGRWVRESEHYFSSGQDGIYRKEKELRIVVLNIQHEVFPSD